MASNARKYLQKWFKNGNISALKRDTQPNNRLKLRKMDTSRGLEHGFMVISLYVPNYFGQKLPFWLPIGLNLDILGLTRELK